MSSTKESKQQKPKTQTKLKPTQTTPKEEGIQ